MATDPMKSGYKTDGGNVVSPKARASFVNIFRPGKTLEPGQEPKYSITLLFPKDADLALLKKMAQEALAEKFGEAKLKDPAFQKRLRSPFRDQGEKAFEGYEAGAIFVTATSKQRPGIVDGRGGDVIEEREVYSGCYVRASLRAFAYDQKGNVGVAFGLQNVQKLADGDPLGGRARPEAEFVPVEEEAATEGAGGLFD